MSSNQNCINLLENSQGIDLDIFLDIFQKLSPSERRIWEVLCSYSRHFISVFPSQITIANLSKCTDRTVRRALTKFKDLNWVHVTRRRYTSCIYKIKKELRDINTRASSSFLRGKSSTKGDTKTTLKFVQAFQESFTPKQKKIFASIQQRSVYRCPFFSYRSLANSCKCSVGAVCRFLNKFRSELGFSLFRRGKMKSIFSIHEELIHIDMRKPKTFELATYVDQKLLKPKIPTRVSQINDSRFMLRNVPLSSEDMKVISRYKPTSVAKAVEDLETYQRRCKVKNPAGFLVSRCQSYSKQIG